MTIQIESPRPGFFHLATPCNTEATPKKKETPLSHPNWRWQGLVLLGFAVLFVCVLVPFLLKYNRVKQLRSSYSSTGDLIAPSPDINMLVSLSGMSTDNYQLAVSGFLVNVPKSVMNNESTRILTPFRIQVGTAVAAINENTSFVNAPITSQIPLVKGSLSWYPFDTYYAKLEVQAVTGTSMYNAGGFKPIQDFKFTVLMPKDDFSWVYKVTLTAPGDFEANVPGIGTIPDPSRGYTSMTLEITRDFNIYTALLFIGIWAVTIAIGYIGSMSVIWKRRPPDNPVIFVSALFAVPTFRNTAPGKPPYGCLFDVFSTYFSIGVIITFLLLVAFAYMKKQKKAGSGKDDDTIPVATLDAGGVAGDVADGGVAADAGVADAGV
ncbi:unnamed protein product [Aphanomyces euteiches]